MGRFDAIEGNLVKIRPRVGTVQVSRGRTSLVTTHAGQIHKDRPVEGLYVYDTRVLSRYAWTLNGKVPALSCSSNLEQYAWLGYFIQAPADCKETPAHKCNPLEETVELRISRDVGEGMHEDLYLTNHTQVSTAVTLEAEFEIAFEAQEEAEKGRKQFGKLHIEHSKPSPGVWETMAHYLAEHHYSHQGNEGTAHFDRGVLLRIENASAAPQISDGKILFQVQLEPHEEWHACVSWIAYVEGKRLPLSTRCKQVLSNDWDARRARFFASSTSFSFPHSDDLTATVSLALNRSKNDLEILRMHDLETHGDPHRIDGGIALAAGIPTYQEVFGRDMQAAAWQAALLSPTFLRGALNVLNTLPASEENAWRDAEPHRLPHEIHTDPLSILNFRPKSLYFGSVSASYLFPISVASLWHWTGDLEAVRRYANTALNAIRWADKYSLDSTGFYRYKTHSDQGVKNQGWKDSSDAIVYPDGSQVDAPIGTCEMQGFMYGAKLLFSETMFRLGDLETARRLYREAHDLKERFNDKFWMEDEGYVAMGIDPKGEPIRSIASDPGHCLLAGIVDDSRVKRVAARLMRPDMFSGWGIRTLSAEHPAYNPFAYHRGTVWPVATAAFVAGFSRYGLHGEMHQLAKAIFEASSVFENHRLPEVFCGHQRTEDTPFPGIYTQADWPQAWSASAPFTVIEAMLGLYPYAPEKTLFVDPQLPDWLPEITLHELHVGDAVVALKFRRKETGATDFEIADVRGTLHIVRQSSPWSLTSKWTERMRDLAETVVERRRAS